MSDTILIDSKEKYTKAQIQDFLEFSPEQLKLAEKEGLLSFFNNSMYGVYFFQFLCTNAKKLEQIKHGNYISNKPQYQ